MCTTSPEVIRPQAEASQTAVPPIAPRSEFAPSGAFVSVWR